MAIFEEPSTSFSPVINSYGNNHCDFGSGEGNGCGNGSDSGNGCSEGSDIVI